MMNTPVLLQQLIATDDRDERLSLLRAQRHMLDAAFFQKLKEFVRKLILENSQEALRVSAIGLEAGEFAQEREGVAYAWWARGNALVILGELDDGLAAFSAAISLFTDLGQTEQVAQLQTNCMTPLMWAGRLAEAQAMGQSALKVLAKEGESRPLANLLLSLGALARRRGDHVEALEQAKESADIFARLDDPVQVARCQITQAVALEQLDRFQESESLLQNALRVLRGHEKWPDWARAALNLGILRARLADHQTGLHWMEQSRQAFLKAGVEMDAAVADLYRAQTFLDVNLLPEAETLSKDLIESFSRFEMPRQMARAVLLLTEVYTRRELSDLALQELDHARQIFRLLKDAVEIAQIDLRRATLLRVMGRPGEASRLASEAAEALAINRYPLRHAEAHLVIAACCEDMGMIEEAQVAYRVAWLAGSYPTGATEPPPALAYRIAYARGAIAEAASQRRLAQGEYDRAVSYLERTAWGLSLDELRGGYLSDKRSVYEAALCLALEDGRMDDAFRYSEQARAGALRGFLAGTGYTTKYSPGAQVDSLTTSDSELEALKARWNWRTSILHRPVDLAAEADEEITVAENLPARLGELANLERELADAYRRYRLANPSLAIISQETSLELDKVRSQLPEDAALLAFEHIDEQCLVFVIARDLVDVMPLGSLTTLRRSAVNLRHALEEVRLFDNPADIVMLEKDLLLDLQALYRMTLARPLARLGSEIRRLLIVPCDVLSTLPFEAFHDGRRHLLERFALCYLPAASLLTALPAGRDSKVGHALILGHSRRGQLPSVLKESTRVTQTLAKSLDRQTLLLTEAEATAAALHHNSSQAGLLHIAAHGAFRSDAPLFSSLLLSDGPLTVNDIYGLDLSQSALVTLSGCQTGVGQGRGGEMLGLTQAFFFAGAPTLTVSRWRVDDEMTANLMQNFYRALTRGETVSESLRTAQLNTLAYRPHAYYWAAFAVWGRGFDSIFQG